MVMFRLSVNLHVPKDFLGTPKHQYCSETISYKIVTYPIILFLDWLLHVWDKQFSSFKLLSVTDNYHYARISGREDHSLSS